MTIPTDTFHTPGNHVLGAGVVYFSTTDGGAERPIIQTDQLSLQTEVETVSRQDSVGGPRHVDDVEIVSVRRTLIIGTNDVIDKNLGLYFGEFATEDVASASGTKDIASPDAGEWFQITPHPQPLSVSSVATSVELVEGVDYQLHLQRGRIQFLESFPNSTVTVTYEAEGTRVLTVGPKKAVRGQLRFISEPTAGTGYDLFMPSVVLRPSGAIDFKSRSDWMRIGLEIEVLGSILEMVEQSSAVVSSPPAVSVPSPGAQTTDALFEIEFNGTAFKPSELVTPGHVLLLAAKDGFPHMHDYSETIGDSDLVNFDVTDPNFDFEDRRSLFFADPPTLIGLDPPDWILVEGTWRVAYEHMLEPGTAGDVLFVDWITPGETPATNRLYGFGIRDNGYIATMFAESGSGVNRNLTTYMPKNKAGRDYVLSASRTSAGELIMVVNGIQLQRIETTTGVTVDPSTGIFTALAEDGSAGEFSQSNLPGNTLPAIIEMSSTLESAEDQANNELALACPFTEQELEFIEWDDFTTGPDTVALFQPDDSAGWVDVGPNSTTFDTATGGAATLLFADRLCSDYNGTLFQASTGANPHLALQSSLTIEMLWYCLDTTWASPSIAGSGESEATNYMWNFSNEAFFAESGGGANISFSWPTPLDFELGRLYYITATVTDNGDGTADYQVTALDDDGVLQDTGAVTDTLNSGGSDATFRIRDEFGATRYIHIRDTVD